MANHAKLSPSSAGRWIKCPGSVHMQELFPQTTSPNAEEGTLAHRLAEFEINNLETDHKGPAYKKGRAAIKRDVDAFYEAHPDMGETFKTMSKALEPYIDFVNARYQESLAADPASELMTEQRVSFGEYVPGGYGTSDVVIIGGDRATVIDLKFGKGVPVSAKENPQARLYALGAVLAFDLVYDFSIVTSVIYQPRLDSMTEETLPVSALLEWAAEIVKPAAALALSEDPPYHPGDWCHNYFCPGAGACKARAEYALQLEKYARGEKGNCTDYNDPALLSDTELSDALSLVDFLKQWTKDLDAFALMAALDGREIPGWKVVEGRANRKYKDEAQVAAAAVAAGYEEAVIYERKLLTMTNMEKLMGKKQFREVLEKPGLVYKPQGSPTLAPVSDTRPAFNSAKSDFKED